MSFIRFSIWDEIYTINDEIKVKKFENIAIVIDRLVKKDFSLDDSPDTKRLKDSINLAYKIWIWQLEISFLTWEKSIDKSFSNIFVCSNCWHIPADLSISSFSFNSHQWACPDCHWLGIKKVFLEERIVNPNLTLLEWAITWPWFWGDMFFELLKEFWKKNKIDLNKSYEKLTKREKDLIMYWTWDKLYSVNFKTESWQKRVFSMKFEWIMNVLTRRYYDWWADKWIYDEYIVDMDCPTCGWYRLNEESLSVYLNWLNIWQLSDLSVTK